MERANESLGMSFEEAKRWEGRRMHRAEYSCFWSVNIVVSHELIR
jgi:hypothetical protein